MKGKNYMVWTTAVVFVVFSVLFTTVASFAQETADEEEDAFGSIMNTGYAKIDEVNFTAPAPEAPCKVTAKITVVGIEDDENLKVKSAKLTYLVNGDRGKAITVDMIAEGDVYSAEVPGQPAGTKVAFYITVIDTQGNTSTEALPVESKEKVASEIVAGVPDMDNSVDLVNDSADILGTYIGYDNDNIYAGFDLQGDLSGGTIEPPYIQIYGIKFTNPDVEQNEGLMVGKLWVIGPLVTDKSVQDKFLPQLLNLGKDYIDKIPAGELDKFMQNGLIVLDISKLMGGQWLEGILFAAEPTRIDAGDAKKFVGFIKRSALGENTSGFYRMIVLTAANASIQSFAPIPLNCSHFMQIYTRSHEYEVK